MPITRRGIYHDLRESEYTTSNQEVVLFFSSIIYRDRFLKDVKEYRERKMRILKRTHCMFYNYYRDRLNLYYDIEFYNIVEKRGFRCKYKGDVYSCREIQKLGLQKTIDVSINDWSKTPEQNSTV